MTSAVAPDRCRRPGSAPAEIAGGVETAGLMCVETVMSIWPASNVSRAQMHLAHFIDGANAAVGDADSRSSTRRPAHRHSPPRHQ